MKSEAILTIIIPVFNTADVLPRCLDSLLNQVNKCIKLLIIDDCSTDTSLDIIMSYAQKHENIKFISSPMRLGAGKARNLGLEEVTTKYVSFLDSDDWVDSATYQKVIACLEENEQCDVAIFGVKSEYDHPALSKFKCNYEYANIIDNRYALTLLCKTINYDNVISSMLGNKVYRTELINNNHLKFMHEYFEDVYFSFLSLFYSKYIFLVDNVYLHYYQRSGSVMHSFSKEYIDGLINIFFDIKFFLEKENCFEKFQSDYFSLLNKSLYSLLNMIFSADQNHITQKKYIIYLIECLTTRFNISDIINHLDINLIRELFHL